MSRLVQQHVVDPRRDVVRRRGSLRRAHVANDVVGPHVRAQAARHHKAGDLRDGGQVVGVGTRATHSHAGRRLRSEAPTPPYRVKVIGCHDAPQACRKREVRRRQLFGHVADLQARLRARVKFMRRKRRSPWVAPRCAQAVAVRTRATAASRACGSWRRWSAASASRTGHLALCVRRASPLPALATRDCCHASRQTR